MAHPVPGSPGTSAWADGVDATVASLGNAATMSVGTAAGTVAAGDDSRFGSGGSGVQPWAPTTAYTLGQQIVSPNNDVGTCNVAHTSAATYTPTEAGKWDLSSTYAPRVSRAKHAPAFGIYFPEAEGGVGDGTTDDSAAIQATFTLAGNATGKATVYLDKTYRVLTNLYGFGHTNYEGPGELLLDSDLTVSDGNAYWINMGVKTKNGTVSSWTGRWSVNLRATATAGTIGRMFNIHRGIYCWVERTKFDMLACAASSTIGAIGIYNNAGWCLDPARSHIHIVGNTILAAQANDPGGSEGIGVGPCDHLWIEDNYIHGVGDDPIGIHESNHYHVSGNRCFSRDGRLYVSGGTKGHIFDNHFERIANPDASWASGGALMMFEIETATQPAPADTHVHDNRLVHGSGIVSSTYGIRLKGTRRFDVHDNSVHDTSGFGYALTWEGQDGTAISWTDSEGIEGDAKLRTRDLRVCSNYATGVGADGQMKELTAFAGDCPGPVTFSGNVAGVGGTTFVTAAAYRPLQSAGGVGVAKYKGGIYHAVPSLGPSTGTPAVGTAQAQGFVLDEIKTLVALAVEVTTLGAAGAVRRFGVYADAGGYPGALVLDLGTVAADAGGAGLKEITCSQVLAPGTYWIVDVAQVATSIITTHIAIPIVPIGFGTALTLISVSELFAYQATGVTGALPATWPATVGASGGNCPRMVWKFS